MRVSPVSLTFTSGNWPEPQTVTVRAVEDEDALADGVVRLTHEVSGGDYGSETAAGVGVTIIENDTPTLSIADARGAEGSGDLLFEVVLSQASSGGGDGGLRDGGRDGGVGGIGLHRGRAGTLTFSIGGDDGTVDDFGLTVLDDGEDEEEEETFTVELSGASERDAGGREARRVRSRTTTIRRWRRGSGRRATTAAEGGSSAVVAVELSGDPERTVEIAVTAAGANGADSGDYTVTGTTVTFGSGETAKEVTVAAVDDRVDDDGESVTLGLGTLPAGVTAGNPATAVVTLVDNDDAGRGGGSAGH